MDNLDNYICLPYDTAQVKGVTKEGQEPLEVTGPSFRIGLSGANKRMLHLLKKARVQLIKIDQQKQLKLSQVNQKSIRFQNL